MPSDGKARAQDFQLLGTWVYGSKPNKYHITQTAEGQLAFEGPHTAGGTVTGVLQPNGDWFQTDLVTKAGGECVGKIRLRYVKEFGIACSNFKSAKALNGNWGKDIFANREELALADGSAAKDKSDDKKDGQKPKKKNIRVEVDKEEELLLVGECNNWNIGEAKKKYRFTVLPEDYGEGRLSYLRVEVGLEDFAFQLVSAKKGWDWRLYPPLNSKADLSLEPGDVTVRPAGEDGDRIAQGRNFHIRGKKGWSLMVVAWIKDFQNMALCYTDPYDRKNKKWGTPGSISMLQEGEMNKPPPFPKEPEVDTRSPYEFKFSEIEPLQLVGECCKWNDATEGLGFSAEQRLEGDLERSHSLVFRMQARKVDFQIVSRKAGFKWRLFPERNGQRIWRGKTARIESVLGGESDGHNKNFVLEESFLSIVKLTIDLQEVYIQGGHQLGKVYLWYTVAEHAAPQVGIAPKWIQFPPKSLCCLDEEFLAAATTPEEKEDVMSRRKKLISELRWTLVKEYADERVQDEVLALRKHYPYHGRKSMLSLEFDEELGKRQALMDGSGGTATASAPAAQSSPQAHAPAGEAGAGAQPTAEPEEGGTMTVTVHISRELEVSVPIDVLVGMTIGELRAKMVDEDPTGATRLEDIWLSLPRAAVPLADSVRLSRAMAELEVCAPGAADVEYVIPSQGAASGLTGAPVGPAESAAPPGAAAEAGKAQELTPLEAYRQDFELKLSLTRQKLQSLAEKASQEGAAAAGVTSALKEQLEKQAKAFEVALEVAREAKTLEAAEREVKKKWEGAEYEDSVFGTADTQWAYALQELPSVCSAQRRALRQHNIPSDTQTAKNAVISIARRSTVDVDAAVASTLVQKRLRFFASPGPDMLKDAAKGLEKDRVFIGTPQDWFHGLDLLHHADWTLVRPDLETMWKKGHFKQKFGGPKSGLFRVMSDEDLHSLGCRALLSAAVTLKDQLQLLIGALGQAGEKLRVEPRVMVSFHSQGEVLPSRIDSAGTARRLTLTLHYSMGHFRTLDGGALKLSRVKGSSKELEVPAAGGYFCTFFTQEWKQAVDMVKLSSGRWALTACAEDIEVVNKENEVDDKVRGLIRGKTSDKAVLLEPKPDVPLRDNFSKISEECAVCQFSGGDGISMNCLEGHRICRQCIQKEIRAEIQPTCPACVNNTDDDRVFVADRWDLFESNSIEDIGCICPRAGEFDNNIDPGSRVVISGQTRESGLNGKLAEAIWWDASCKAWDVRVFALNRVVKMAITSLNIAEPCPAGGGLGRCPCWPTGRGVYPISLGCRCCVKQGILECGDAGSGNPAGWPYFHGMVHLPFDWNLTSLEGVLFFLRHSFEHFFHFNDMRVVKAVNRDDVKFDNFYSSMHAFIHHHPQKDGTRLRLRADRFKVLCRHSRDVRAARTLLFIRYFHNSDEINRIDELYSLLRLWAGANIRLVCVVMKQTEKGKEVLYRHARFPRVLIYLVGFIQVMEFAPFKEACRFSIYDEVGMLHVRQMLPTDIAVRPFRDPYTTQSDLCPEGDWLVSVKPKDPTFYPDCPGAQKQARIRSPLVDAIVSGDEDMLVKAIQSSSMHAGSGADPNAWDAHGRRPLHFAGEVERLKGKMIAVSTKKVVRMVGHLLLAHADPNCHDVNRVTALQHARQSNASPEVCALMAAAVLEESVDRVALFNALEMMDKLPCSRLARILDVGGLRAMGEAELTWRHPPPDSEAYIAELEDVIVGLERLPEAQRKKEMKRLLLEWHPDKNADRLDLATTVFQFLQAQKDRVIKR